MRQWTLNTKRINKKQRTTNNEHLCHPRIVATELSRGLPTQDDIVFFIFHFFFIFTNIQICLFFKKKSKYQTIPSIAC